MSRHSTARSGHRLFWRVFVHGLLLIVVVAVVSGSAFHLLGDEPIWRRVHTRLGQLAERAIVPGATTQEELTAKLEDFKFITGGAIAVYEVDGTLLASAGAITPPALLQDAARELDPHDWFRAGGNRYVAVLLPSHSAYAVFEPPNAGSPAKLALGLALLLLVVALMSIPLARAIARPLERITSTARRLGDGELAARTGVTAKGELGVLAGTLDEMAERLERKLRGEKELLAGASHEIRTPLARIKVALELSDEDGVTLEELRGNLQGIAGDVAELERLVEDSLTAARLDLADGDGDSLRLRRETVKLRELIESVRDRFSASRPERELKAEIDANAVEIEADPTLLRRLLANLIDNAAKYSKDEQPIELAARVEDEHAVFEVRDHGIGIPEGELAQVFEPFHRTDRSRTRGTGGTGLGLTLCKRIAEAHRGTIEALARDGGGVVFRVTLPQHRAP